MQVDTRVTLDTDELLSGLTEGELKDLLRDTLEFAQESPRNGNAVLQSLDYVKDNILFASYSKRRMGSAMAHYKLAQASSGWDAVELRLVDELNAEGYAISAFGREWTKGGKRYVDDVRISIGTLGELRGFIDRVGTCIVRGDEIEIYDAYVE